MDFNIKEGKSMITNDIELILQQIDILFDTSPRELLGFVDYGTEYDRYLYDLKVSNEGLKTKIYSDLNSLDLKGFVPNVEIYMLQGSERDIALINIELSNDYNTFSKTYNIS